MTTKRFHEITSRYHGLKVAVVGDFCLDRYLEIDPSKREVSIETGLPVHNVVNVRAQPGGAGTVVNNLAALGLKAIYPVGFAGEDGEGYELRRVLATRPGVRLDHFEQTNQRRTFTYSKPLVMEPGKPPRELNRLDQKNWTATPPELSARVALALLSVADDVDALILLNQADAPETGVLTRPVLDCVSDIVQSKRQLPILADSRSGLGGFPPVIFKMNAAELAGLAGVSVSGRLEEIAAAARALARRNGRPVFVTLAEHGMLGATPDGQTEHLHALPSRGEIDVVGAGDAVTANLTAALAAGATLTEAMALANCAASVVVHQVGTTGTASIEQLRGLLTP